MGISMLPRQTRSLQLAQKMPTNLCMTTFISFSRAAFFSVLWCAACHSQPADVPPAPTERPPSTSQPSTLAISPAAPTTMSSGGSGDRDEVSLPSEEVPVDANPSSPATASPPPERTVGGDRATVARKARERLRYRFRDIRACYDQGYQKNAQLQGTVVFRFTLLPTGGISQPANAGSTISDPDVLRCVSNVVVRTTFDPFEGKGVSLVFPVKFMPPSSGHPSR